MNGIYTPDFLSPEELDASEDDVHVPSANETPERTCANETTETHSKRKKVSSDRQQNW